MDRELIPITLFVCMAAVFILTPLARALARSIERKAQAGSSLPSEIEARLERMEHAIESIAIEVERISEGQRFTTRLLAERPEPVARDARALGEGDAR